MIPVVRTAGMYLFLLVLLRLSGKRTLSDVTVFDFILLLVMSEACQQALTGNDFSLTNAMLIVLTLVVVNHVSDWLSYRFRGFDHAVNDGPLLLIADGELRHDRMRQVKVRVDDILEQARQTQGLERLDQVRHAVLERDGTISIIPRGDGGGG